MNKCNCTVCGKDIRYKYKFYRNNKPYCYFCNERIKTENKIIDYLYMGKSAPFIAKKLGITEEEVKSVRKGKNR